MHTRTARPAAPEDASANGMLWSGRIGPVAIATAVVLLGLLMLTNIGFARWIRHLSSSPSAGSKPVIDGIPCQVAEMSNYHVHAQLSIFKGMKQIIVPATVGIPAGDCFYWLHTHDDSGVIHVEAPKVFKPALGNFFDIWGRPLSRKRVADVSVGRGQRMRVFVHLELYRGNPRVIQLRDHRDITIEVGPPFRRPQKYDFPGNGY